MSSRNEGKPSEVAYVSWGAQHPTASNLPTNKNFSEPPPPEPITHARSFT